MGTGPSSASCREDGENRVPSVGPALSTMRLQVYRPPRFALPQGRAFLIPSHGTRSRPHVSFRSMRASSFASSSSSRARRTCISRSRDACLATRGGERQPRHLRRVHTEPRDLRAHDVPRPLRAAGDDVSRPVRVVVTTISRSCCARGPSRTLPRRRSTGGTMVCSGSGRCEGRAIRRTEGSSGGDPRRLCRGARGIVRQQEPPRVPP